MLHTNYKKREYIAKVLGFIPSVVISEKHVGKRVESKVGRLLLAMYLTKTKGNGLERAVSTAMYQDFFVVSDEDGPDLTAAQECGLPVLVDTNACFYLLRGSSVIRTVVIVLLNSPVCPVLGSSPSLFLTYDPLKGRDFSFRRNKVFLVSVMDRLVL